MKLQHSVYGLFGIAGFSVIISFIFLSSSNRTVGTPAGLVFNTLAMLSAVTAGGLRSVGKRLANLEKASKSQQPFETILPESGLAIHSGPVN